MGLREISNKERVELEARGCFAEDWSKIRVSESFSSTQISMCRFSGEVEIHDNAQAHNSTIANYSLRENSLVDRVTLLECSAISSFGNGVEVAALNECGGRTIRIFESMSAQVAYIATLYRHRPSLIARIEAMIETYAAQRESRMGVVGRDSKIIGAGIIRNLKVGEAVTIEGASRLQNGTLLSGAYVGADVKASDFIAVEGSRIDNGAIIERCFVGENVIISNGFTAVDSLFFASSHCENGEAASVFAGPYTVSHHKSSLLIAGMFSFFNAGSGSNQSNHLFKCGPVHQGVHLRGCKFGSSAYVMLPALNGAYTSVIGSHYSHHDTSEFPFSYLIKKDDRSTLIPAANLISYGYVRDIEKWVKRDRRTVKRDIVDMQEHNPYILGMLIDAVNISNKLLDENPNAESYVHNKVFIDGDKLRRALTYYNKAVAGSIGAILSRGDNSRLNEGRCKWLDIAGQYITTNALESILKGIEDGFIASLNQINEQLQEFNKNIDDYAYDYAVNILGELLGHTPSSEEISQTISAAASARNHLRALAERDRERDSSAAMAISYGVDSDNESDRLADFRAVRGL